MPNRHWHYRTHSTLCPLRFVSPPYYFAWIFCWGIFISNLCPPWPLWLRQTRGRLEFTVPPYIWSQAKYWLVIHRPSDWLRCSRLVSSWWWCENCIAFSDRSQSVPSLILFHDPLACRTEPLRASSQAARDGDGPLLFLSHAPQRGKGTYKRD